MAGAPWNALWKYGDIPRLPDAYSFAVPRCCTIDVAHSFVNHDQHHRDIQFANLPNVPTLPNLSMNKWKFQNLQNDYAFATYACVSVETWIYIFGLWSDDIEKEEKYFSNNQQNVWASAVGPNRWVLVLVWKSNTQYSTNPKLQYPIPTRFRTPTPNTSSPAQLPVAERQAADQPILGSSRVDDLFCEKIDDFLNFVLYRELNPGRSRVEKSTDH